MPLAAPKYAPVAPKFPPRGGLVHPDEMARLIDVRRAHAAVNWWCRCGECILARKDPHRIVVTRQGTLDYSPVDQRSLARSTPTKPWGTDTFDGQDDYAQYMKVVSVITERAPYVDENDLQPYLQAHWEGRMTVDEICDLFRPPSPPCAPPAPFGRPMRVCEGVTYDPTDPYLTSRLLPFGSDAAFAEAMRIMFAKPQETMDLIMERGRYADPAGLGGGKQEIVLNMVDFLMHPTDRGLQLCNFVRRPRTKAMCDGFDVLVVDGAADRLAVERRPRLAFKKDLVAFLVGVLVSFLDAALAQDARTGFWAAWRPDIARQHRSVVAETKAYLAQPFNVGAHLAQIFNATSVVRHEVWKSSTGLGSKQGAMSNDLKRAYLESKYIIDELGDYMDMDEAAEAAVIRAMGVLVPVGALVPEQAD